MNELKTGTKLKLELESDNPYDSNAVALYFNDKKLGYLPRRNNEIISTLLSYGYNDILETFYYSKNENTVPQIIIKIKEKNIN
ncbi:MAG: HIRAN domain-containing protein [Clostridia bacterium]|nr:HIRAN domain-containing protein [Clostridia bacterium]